MPEAYDNEEAQKILQLAMLKQGQDNTLLRSQLYEIAEDLGISAATLEAAEEEWKVQLEEQQARQEFSSFRHQQLRRSIVQHIGVNSVLVLLNGMTTHRVDWAVYPAVIWGAAIFWEAWQVLWPKDEQFNRAFRRWRLRQQIGASFKAISERFKLSWSVRNTFNANEAQADDIDTSLQSIDESSPDKDSDALKVISPDNQISVVPVSEAPRSSNPSKISPTQKSRLQNRVHHHHASHNRISNFSHQNQRGAEQNETDHVS
ncbi:MAG: 2TM domain-containing protein [Cyanobacteria bacterium J06627_8]